MSRRRSLKSRRRCFAHYACVCAHERAVRLFGGRAEMAQKAGFCPQKRAESGICGSSRRDLPMCASARMIERKRRLSRGLRRSGESCGALFGRYDLPWRRALTQKYFDGRELCGGLAQAIRARVEQRTRRFALGRGLWRRCKIGRRAALAASRSGRQTAKRRSEGAV